ncbi:hypothetical protein QCA50_010132 [Cerrena zonata]|uniref:C2H2-type domain-containing protein n=1 Tax=Cerrena zonata TaxID=2478898 RepID=A0AAW0FZL9_9APHY
MVKAHVQKTPQGSKDAPRKKASSVAKKKSGEAVSWPCKITGCSKVFAREADLKRHQRTTKTHTAPGFQCPQCDATFTRTDALRRHQKSRHNGVVIEPTDTIPEVEDDEPSPHEAGPSGSRSSSRSGSPAESNSSDREGSEPRPPAPSTSTSSRSSSYYRPHTMHIGYPPPRPPPVMLDPNYPPQVAIPTSAARLQHPTWTPPHTAWGPDGSPLPPGYPVPPYYPQPSPYYRSHVMPSSLPPHHMYSEYLPHYPPPHIPYTVHPPLSTVTGAPITPLPPPPRPSHYSDGDISSEESSPSPIEKSRQHRSRSSPSYSAGASSRPNSSVPKSPSDGVSEDEKMNAEAASILKAIIENGAGPDSPRDDDEVMSQPSTEGEGGNHPPSISDISPGKVASPSP